MFGSYSKGSSDHFSSAPVCSSWPESRRGIAAGFALACAALGLVTEFYFVPSTAAYKYGRTTAGVLGIMAYVFGFLVRGLLAIDRKYPNAYPDLKR